MAELRLTDRVLRRLQSEAQSCEYTDPTVAGFGVRVFTTGRISFFLRYYAPGERREKRTTFGYYCTPDQKQRLRSSGRLPPLSLAEARDKAKELLGLVACGRDPSGKSKTQADSLTFEEFAEQYLRRHARLRKRPNSLKNDLGVLKRDILPGFGRRLAAEISIHDVVQLVDDIVDRGSPSVANKALSLIRAIYNWGLSRGVVTSNPAWGVRKPAPDRPRDRVFSDEEIRAFWLHLNTQTPVIASAFRLLFLTMQRSGEIVALHDSWIHDGLIEIPRENYKGRRVHVVPLSNFALEEVQRARQRRLLEGLVLPSPRTGLRLSSNTLNAAARRISQELHFEQPVVPHDIRRTVFTRLTMMGVEETLVHRIAGHSLGKLSRTYNRYAYLEERREALEAWATQLRRIVGVDGR